MNKDSKTSDLNHRLLNVNFSFIYGINWKKNLSTEINEKYIIVISSNAMHT